MVKKRLIFVLLFCDGYYVLSRNFRLQRVGDIGWLQKNYNFLNTSRFIDELVVLNVSRQDASEGYFLRDVERLSRFCFMPFVLGGKIKDFQTGQRYFSCGADKIVLNTAIKRNPNVVNELVSVCGSQAIMASVDCRYSLERNVYGVCVENGSVLVEENLEKYLQGVVSLGVGELFLTSMDRDGTGQGYDMQLLGDVEKILDNCRMPIVLSGGAGKKDHLMEGILHPRVSGVATANLLNFIGDSLKISRDFLIQKGLPLARFIYTSGDGNVSESGS